MRCDLRMSRRCSRAEGAFKKVFHANFLFNESFLKLLETLLGFDLFCSGLTHSFPSNKTLNIDYYGFYMIYYEQISKITQKIVVPACLRTIMSMNLCLLEFLFERQQKLPRQHFEF